MYDSFKGHPCHYCKFRREDLCAWDEFPSTDKEPGLVPYILSVRPINKDKPRDYENCMAYQPKITLLKTFTVFYSHPSWGCGSYNVNGLTAERVGNAAAEELPEDWIEDDLDGDEAQLELDTIRDDLEIEVWEGDLTEKPDSAPDWVFE